MRCHLLLLLPAASLAFQLPFKVPFLDWNVSAGLEDATVLLNNTPRIAIIGAGAGGSSAAFWISKAKERYGVNVEIDIYEKESYIGGRSTIVYPYGNTSLPPLELGASIFVSANKNLWRASDEFNLTRRDFETGSTTGIWDGERFIITFGDSWWDSIKLVWRYGLFSPRRADSLVANMIKKFITLYIPEPPKWDSIADLASSLEWLPLVNNTTLDYFSEYGVSEAFVYEVVEAATRVNYGQDVTELHALEGAASMATGGATGIQGGNIQLFEHFLKRSGASVHLNTTVTSIKDTSSPSHRWEVETTSGVVNYKAVILAAPFHSTGIALPSSLSTQIPPQPYVHLHVTLLTTTSPAPGPAYFSELPNSDLPTMILTTGQGFRNGGKAPEFNSLTYHGLVRDGEWAVKIFSKQRISDEWLDKVFAGKVGWVFRKEWESYPKLPPTTSFPPVKLAQGFYYVNAFEPFISTMETETISSRNIVDLLLKEEFESSICKSQASDNATLSKSEEEFVYGWDC